MKCCVYIFFVLRFVFFFYFYTSTAFKGRLYWRTQPIAADQQRTGDRERDDSSPCDSLTFTRSQQDTRTHTRTRTRLCRLCHFVLIQHCRGRAGGREGGGVEEFEQRAKARGDEMKERQEGERTALTSSELRPLQHLVVAGDFQPFGRRQR